MLFQMAADSILVCNFRKCRKRLTKFAWVTSCSHIFCEEDGSRRFSSSLSCPACNTQLSSKYDIVRIDLQPSEPYKSMLLAGQSPETTLEICKRSLAFWTYQINQELSYQSHVTTRSKERTTQAEQYYEEVINRTQSELASTKAKLTATSKEVESVRSELREVSDKLLEKTRQLQKMQMLYEAMKRKTMLCDDPKTGCIPSPCANNCDMLPPTEVCRSASATSLTSMDHPEFASMRIPLMSPAPQSRGEGDFVLKPTFTPVRGVHCDPSGDRLSMESRFKLDMDSRAFSDCSKAPCCRKS